MVTMSLSSEFQLHWRLIMKTSINLCIEIILCKERENAIWGSVWSKTTTAIDSKSSFCVWIQEREVHWDLWKFILNEIFCLVEMLSCFMKERSIFDGFVF